MKKLIAFILCLSLFCVFPSVYAESDNLSLEVLTALEIGDFSGSEKEVSRGQFIGAVSDILNYANRPKAADGIFPDVTSDSPYSGAIYDAHKRGLISGYTDGTFGIDSPILFEHAVKILVSALGYDNMALAKGGYPTGYMIIAEQNRLMRGVVKKGGDTLSSGEAARLIENALNTPVYQQTVYGDETAVFEAFEGETLLKVYAKIKKIEGKVSDNGITSLTGKSVTPKGNVIIENEVYSAGDSSAEKFLGYEVEAYVTCTGDAQERVLYITKGDNVNLLAIPATRILHSDADFSVQKIVYEDVYGKTQTATVDGVADCIYNGSVYFDLTAEDLKLDFGKIVLIDNNSDNVYDVIYVETTQFIVASAANEVNKTIYAKNGAVHKFDGFKNIEIYRDGVKCGFSDINEWDVICAQISLDKSTVLLNISSQKLLGVVDSVSKGDSTISVDGKYYHVAAEEVMDRIDVSSSYEFCVDADMNIVGIKSENQDNVYVGILMDAAIKDGVDSKVQVKILSKLGNFDIIDLSDRVLIDGDSNKTDSQKVTYIRENMQYKIVSCKKDGSGNISEITLPYSGKPASYQSVDDLKVDYDGGERLIFCSPGNLGGKAVCDGATTVFLIPYDKNDLDDFTVTTGEYFIHSSYYTFSAYSIGEENGYSEYVIHHLSDTSEFSSESNPFVVESVSSVLNSEGEIVDMLRGYGRSGVVQYETRYSGLLKESGVKAGDVIRCIQNANKKVIQVEKLVDGQTLKAVTEVGSSFAASPRMELCSVYSRQGNVLSYTKTDLSKPFNEDAVKSTLTVQLLANGTIVYEVDTKNDYKITQVDYNAIMPYKGVGAECSKMFIHSHSGSTRLIVIYR